MHYTQPEKERALDAIATLGEKSLPLKEKVLELMRNPNKSCIPAAAWCYYKMTGEHEEAVKATIKILENPSYGSDAARRLGDYGSVGAAAVPALTEQLDNPENSVRENATIALRKIGADAASAVKKLQSIAGSDKDRVIRYEAAKSIEAIKKASK